MAYEPMYFKPLFPVSVRFARFGMTKNVSAFQGPYGKIAVCLSSMCIECKPSISSAVTMCISLLLFHTFVDAVHVFDRKSVVLSTCIARATCMHLPVRLDRRSNSISIVPLN